MTATQELPLFPLHTVLFPGGILPLRIFETRYLDLISTCLRTDSGFGVVTIHEGRETGSPPTRIHPVGTLARIVDFDQLDDGVLGITCLGAQWLRVINHHVRPDQLLIGQVRWLHFAGDDLAGGRVVRPDQLLIGQVRWLPDDPALSTLPSHEPLVRVLRDLLEREELLPYRRFLTPDWENAAWVGNRLAEILPLPTHVRHTLLEMTEPRQRLDILLAIFQEQNIA